MPSAPKLPPPEPPPRQVNGAMLRNLVEGAEAAGCKLQHVYTMEVCARVCAPPCLCVPAGAGQWLVAAAALAPPPPPVPPPRRRARNGTGRRSMLRWRPPFARMTPSTCPPTSTTPWRWGRGGRAGSTCPSQALAGRAGPPHPPAPQEYLEERVAGGAPWTWSALRPNPVCGFSTGSFMNLTTSLAAYSAIWSVPGAAQCARGQPGGARLWRASLLAPHCLPAYSRVQQGAGGGAALPRHAGGLQRGHRGL